MNSQDIHIRSNRLLVLCRNRCSRAAILLAALIAFYPIGAPADEKSTEKQPNLEEIQEEIRRLDGLIRELSGEKSKLEADLKKQEQPAAEKRIHGKINGAFSYQSGSRGKIAGSGNIDITYTRDADSFRFEDYVDTKSANDYTAWRNQATFTYRRRILGRLRGLAEAETIYNDGLRKENIFFGGSFGLVQSKQIKLDIEAGMGMQYRDALYTAAMQRTTAKIDLWQAAELEADVKLIFSGDETLRFELDEKRVRFGINVGRNFKGIKISGYYRYLDDRRGQDYSLAGIRFGKNFRF